MLTKFIQQIGLASIQEKHPKATVDRGTITFWRETDVIAWGYTVQEESVSRPIKAVLKLPVQLMRGIMLSLTTIPMTLWDAVEDHIDEMLEALSEDMLWHRQ